MAVGEARGAQPDPPLAVMTERELASMRAGEGDTIATCDGRHWRATFPGFYEPIHLLLRLRAAEVRRPAVVCWGYRAALIDEDAHLATGSIPVHLMTDVEQYTEGVLSRNRRSDLRKCRRQVELVRLRDPSLLLEQGYGVYMSALRRLSFPRPLAEADYRRRVARKAGDRRRLLVAGLVDGRLGGYLESYAADGALYTDAIFVATDALRTGIGTGLYFETMNIAARAGTIHTVCNGLQRLENSDLSHFKESLGFRAVQVPARVAIPVPIRAAIKVLRPDTCYRLTGVSPLEPPVVGRVP